jgi:NOP5NT (NUC127) domain
MFVLYETPAGYAIFKVNVELIDEKFSNMRIIAKFNLKESILTHFYSKLPFNQLLDEKKIKEVDNLYLEFETPENANKL